MGMKIIAEGVETKEQMDYLLKMGCTYGQGYYFYHPMPSTCLNLSWLIRTISTSEALRHASWNASI